jgi:two-component system NarL family sensor kinase
LLKTSRRRPRKVEKDRATGRGHRTTTAVHERDVALFDAIAGALTATDVEPALEAALGEIVRALQLAAGWIWLTDPETERFYLAAAHELPPYLREPVQMTGDPCWCMESFIDGDFDSKNVDIIACSRLRRGADEGREELTLGLQSHASVVLRFGARRLGIMNVCPPVPRRLSERDLRLLSVAGAQIGLAVERGRLAEEEASAARSGERTRLAREIHDTLAQDLTAIALQLESALRDVPVDSPAATRIATALEVARAAQHLRDGDARDAARARRAIATVRVEGELYRIASEALANARRHADASRIEIDLAVEAGTVVLRVHDDGMGFDPSVRDDERYGLRGMEERARLAGGRLRVVSESGGGTLIEVVVPKQST